MAELAVVDASVVVKWFLRDGSETDSDLADEVLVSFLGTTSSQRGIVS